MSEWKAQLPNGTWVYPKPGHDNEEGLRAAIRLVQAQCEHLFNLDGYCQLGCGYSL